MKRPIAIGLAPNTQAQDAFLALKKILIPFSYNRGSATTNLEKWFEKFFRINSATAFTSGRGALFAVLKSLGIGKGDEVVVQAFTCAAVIQSILTTGAKPVYVDIDVTLSMSPEQVRKKISKKTKAILVQHTFGIPAHVSVLQKIAEEHDIYLVEDAAHTIGGQIENKLLGTFGIASIVSLGRDKAFSCVSGGVALTNDRVLGEKLTLFAKQKGYPSLLWVFQQVLHPIAFYFVILPTYNIIVGKAVLVLLQKLHMLSLPVDITRTTLDPIEVQKLPPVLASLALLQLERVSEMNKRRQQIVQIYEKELAELKTFTPMKVPLLRYPLLIENAKGCIAFLRKQHMYIGNWYSNVIDPKGVSLKKLGYTAGMCSQAEYIATHMVNLPTYPALTDKEVYTITKALKAYVAHTGNNK